MRTGTIESLERGGGGGSGSLDDVPPDWRDFQAARRRFFARLHPAGRDVAPAGGDARDGIVVVPGKPIGRATGSNGRP